MVALYRRIGSWVQRDKGQDLIEYALLLGLLAIICIVAITFAGTQISAMWNAVSTAMVGV